MTRPISDQEVRIARSCSRAARHAMEQVGGDITSENIELKHYMIPGDTPSEEELFGEFFNSEFPV